MQDSSVLIVGAGWLGRPLAEHLMNQGYNVTATKTSEQGVAALEGDGIDALQCNLTAINDDNQNTFVKALQQKKITTIIGCFPPGFRQGRGTMYATQWARLVDLAKQANVRKVIMISSTSVYPDRPTLMTEEMASLSLSQTQADFSDKSVVMLTAEEHVVRSQLDYAIVRCSGLFGPNRHPSRFALKIKSVSDRAPANMLHLHDAIAAVSFVLKEIKNEVLNVTTPDTCDKATFYRSALKAAGVDSSLNAVNSTPDKAISSGKLQAFGFTFKYQHTLDALDIDMTE
ncbi:hypothetical protein BCU70_05910 [Vibrio sp. 10N.286.49.C2]|uniref:NAD-dependent epimerase/dehydratase family protein n=1 Tax=unclassified Vibrio TaxID=2614977 RepID=UPI000C84C5E2|nr:MULTISPECIES: NAD-dependent epimerase/dehydratase family protein [unclassified Vibrio]PMH31436.1 hypothetical protein BCU70_05910 [Vibrio sp. 10N.286.49.C2]PMH50457.1 hypothetical protein BCU66_18270 [Vibrio sp. 10N.286.49.B1]PMH78060.1 hypothetical protein BCU58_11045 [Vibrio sp. 10N.286.48.B7]